MNPQKRKTIILYQVRTKNILKNTWQWKELVRLFIGGFVDPNPKESESFDRIRIRKKIGFGSRYR
jgi:hypothetical protein